MEISTGRLTLRPLIAADARVIVDGIGDLEVSRWLIVVPHPYTLADAEEFLGRACGRPDYLAITRDQALIGIISDDDELGYWLAKPFWGKGFASEALEAMLGRCFANPGRTEVRANHCTENTASGRVLAKAGFVYTGERLHRFARALGAVRESLCMILTRSRWREAERGRESRHRLS